MGSLSNRIWQIVLFFAFVACILLPAIAMAETGGYPDYDAADCSAQYGSYAWCKNGSYISGRGYAYRNCTDYVAWKLESLGVQASKVEGRGNGGQWDDNSTGVTVTSIPEVGDAAVIEPSASNSFGHVAYVEAVQIVSGSYQVEVSQYNANFDGTYSLTSWVPATHYGNFVDFNGVGTPLGGGSASSSSGLIYAVSSTHSVAKTIDTGNVNQLYTLASTDVKESYWTPGVTAVVTNTLLSQPGTVAVVKRITPDGYHHIFAATGSAVTETYWKPGVTPATWQVTSREGVVGAAIDQETDGTFQLYTAATSGVYETYWKPGGAQSTWQVGAWANITGIAKDIDSSGVNQLYTATSSGTWETYWTPGVPGVHSGLLAPSS